MTNILNDEDDLEYHDMEDPAEAEATSRPRLAVADEESALSNGATATGAPDASDTEYHDTEDPTTPTDHGNNVPADEQDDVVEAASQATILPVASLVQPPRELLERLRQLETNQRDPNIPIAIPQGTEDTKKTDRRKWWLVAAWLVSIAVVAVVVDATLGSSSNSNDGNAVEPTASPTSSRTPQDFAELKDLILSVSLDQGASLDDESSPQYSALTWLDGNANIDEYPDWKRVQRYALAVFYYSMNGNEWVANDGWLSDEDECTWVSMSKPQTTCNEEGAYRKIELIANNLEGTLPLELALLSDSLASLHLLNNKIGGVIPTEIGLLTNIGLFELSWNSLTGTVPTELGLFKGIVEFGRIDENSRVMGQGIAVASNQLTGSIHSEMFKLPELRSIVFNDNFLTGTIPSEVGLATNLILYLAFTLNEFSGSLPTELGNLSQLEELWINDVLITGNLPSEIGRMSNLVMLEVEGGDYNGSLPTELGNLERIVYLEVFANRFSGTLPSEIGRLAKLESLTLHDNKFTGAIPSHLGFCESFDFLTLHGNEGFNGTLPIELMNLASLRILTFGGTGISGTLPTEIGLWTNMFWAHFNALGLSGTLPTEIGLMTSLQQLFVSGLLMSGTLPNKELWKLSQLEWLQITNMNILGGSLGSQVGNLSSLVQLGIADTSVTGPIPEELAKLPRLKWLALENSRFVGKVPPSLAGLANSLEMLSVVNNALTGMVPSEILMLTNLDALRLYGNNLTGPFACPDFIEECLLSCGNDSEPACHVME